MTAWTVIGLALFAAVLLLFAATWNTRRHSRSGAEGDSSGYVPWVDGAGSSDSGCDSSGSDGGGGGGGDGGCDGGGGTAATDIRLRSRE